MLFLSKRIKHDFIDCCAQIEHGSLTLKTPDGEVLHFGQGHPEADMEIRDWAVVTALAARGDIGLGETYVAGLWDSSDVESLIRMALMNMDKFGGFAYPGAWQGLKFRMIDRVMRAN